MDDDGHVIGFYYWDATWIPAPGTLDEGLKIDRLNSGERLRRRTGSGGSDRWSHGIGRGTVAAHGRPCDPTVTRFGHHLVKTMLTHNHESNRLIIWLRDCK